MASQIQGEVVRVDANGAAVTDIPVQRLHGIPHDDQTSVACEGHVTRRLFRPEHAQPEMTFLAVCGPSGFLELHLVSDRVDTFLGIHPGSVVSVQW